jgi:hypothetical protein
MQRVKAGGVQSRHGYKWNVKLWTHRCQKGDPNAKHAADGGRAAFEKMLKEDKPVRPPLKSGK